MNGSLGSSTADFRDVNVNDVRALPTRSDDMYRSDTLNSNKMNSKFHFIRSFCEMFYDYLMFKMHG